LPAALRPAPGALRPATDGSGCLRRPGAGAGCANSCQGRLPPVPCPVAGRTLQQQGTDASGQTIALAAFGQQALALFFTQLRGLWVRACQWQIEQTAREDEAGAGLVKAWQQADFTDEEL